MTEPDDAGFDALGWVARSLRWERRLRELEQRPATDPAGQVEEDAVAVSDQRPPVRPSTRSGSRVLRNV